MDFLELDENEFQKFSKEVNCRGFLQSFEMYQRYKKNGSEVYLIGVKREGEVVAAGLVRATKTRFGKIFKAPRGFLLDYDGKDYKKILEKITEGAKEFFQKKGGILLEISPNIFSELRDGENQVISGKNHLGVKETLKKLGYKDIGEYEQVKWTYVLEFQGRTKEEIFLNFRKDQRQRINRAEREGVEVRELKEDEWGVFQKIIDEAGERHGFEHPDMSYYREMKEAFSDKIQILVSEVEIEGKKTAIAVGMFVWDDREVVCIYSGSVREYQKFGGVQMMRWKVIQEALEKGLQRNNFYGIKPVPGNGVYEFKQGFRGNVEELLGTFMLPLNFRGKMLLQKYKYHEFGELY